MGSQEPSLDHYGFMRTGLNYMLMSTLDDDKGSVLLFPAFPAQQWNVRFKMHAPRNTTIEASQSHIMNPNGPQICS